jgi:hypothetical protein
MSDSRDTQGEGRAMQVGQMTHHVSVYEAGRWIGYLTPKGGTNRLRVHAAFFSEEGARATATEIDEQNRDEGLTGKAVPAWRGKRGGR